MKILIVSAEFAPLAKTGGLGDAVAGLSAALGRLGHDVRVLLPRYSHLAGVAALEAHADPGSAVRCVEIASPARPARIYLLDAAGVGPSGRGASGLYAEPGIYLGDERDAARFLALAEGAVAFGAALDWQPELVHCHDWHAALVPALLAERDPAHHRAPSLLTLHNIGYQGVFPAALAGCDRHAALEAHVDRGEIAPVLNFLRTGVASADLLTTVSPTYAREIQTPAYGMGLEDLLGERADSLVGILNGVDYSLWDPSVDPHLQTHYDARNVAPKAAVKRALCESLGLECRDEDPLIGVVTRLVSQKGIDLLAAILPDLLASSSARFALLGSGEPALERTLMGLAAGSPARVSFTRGYSEALAHRILAGSDIVLVPSRYEPCGLTQLYAMRYGSIPVVRATGGLADTVTHFDPENGTGTGSVFNDADPEGLSWGIGQALTWFADGAAWARLKQNAMAADFSWERQAPEYVALYERLLAAH